MTELLKPNEFFSKCYEIAFESIRTFIEITCHYEEIYIEGSKITLYSFDQYRFNTQYLQDEDLVAHDSIILKDYKNFLTSQEQLRHLSFIPTCKFSLVPHKNSIWIRFL